MTETKEDLRETARDLERLLREEFEDCDAIVTFPHDADTFSAFVTSPAFEGKSSRQRDQLVWDAVGAYIKENDITGYDNNRLLTPDEEEDMFPG